MFEEIKRLLKNKFQQFQKTYSVASISECLKINRDRQWFIKIRNIVIKLNGYDACARVCVRVCTLIRLNVHIKMFFCDKYIMKKT